MSIEAATTSIRAAHLELREVANPPPQVRDAIKRLGDAIAWLDAAQGMETREGGDAKQAPGDSLTARSHSDAPTL